jgi:choline dehydrogenase
MNCRCLGGLDLSAPLTNHSGRPQSLIPNGGIATLLQPLPGGVMIDNDNNYDYIIIGAGSAGCALAHRLSEDPDNSVLLLEAGGRDNHPVIHMPLGFAFLMKHKTLNWCYRTEPEPHLDNRELSWPRGKVLGGSSSINGMVYIRGQREDFDQWRAQGNQGWGYDEVLPYFKRAEHKAEGASDLHGADGPLWVEEVAANDKLELAELHKPGCRAIRTSMAPARRAPAITS